MKETYWSAGSVPGTYKQFTSFRDEIKKTYGKKRGSTYR